MVHGSVRVLFAGLELEVGLAAIIANQRAMLLEFFL